VSLVEGICRGRCYFCFCFVVFSFWVVVVGGEIYTFVSCPYRYSTLCVNIYNTTIKRIIHVCIRKELSIVKASYANPVTIHSEWTSHFLRLICTVDVHGGTDLSHENTKHLRMRSSRVGRGNVGQETVGRSRGLYG
jgi:hypothetical protein